MVGRGHLRTWGGHVTPAIPEVCPGHLTPVEMEVGAGHLTPAEPEVGGSRESVEQEVACPAPSWIPAGAISLGA